MGERVNIQYSVDIDELGEEVGRLIGGAYSSLHTVTLDKVPDKDNVLSLRTIQMIEQARHAMADIDARLGDAVNIINGYVSYRSQLVARQGIADAADQEHQENLKQNEHENSLNLESTLRERLKEFQGEQ